MASFSSTRRIAAAKAHEFQLVKSFSHGYRSREDKTNLPPGVLVSGSQNVLTNTSGRIAIRKGYTLYGQSNTTVGADIKSSFDFVTSKGFERHLRAGFLSAANIGKLQYLYTDSSGTVTWRDLITGLSSSDFNFTTFWDFNTEKITLALMVNGGASTVYEWSGAITTLSSATANTITKTGTTTWAQDGFYISTATRQVTINGTVYTYTGGEGTTTLTGVTPNPSAEAVNSVIHQTPIVTTTITSVPATFPISLIENLRNQIYYGSLTDSSVYITKVNNYKDASFTSPVRVVGEGAVVVTTSPTVAFKAQEDSMYISAGKSEWYQTKFTLSSDLAKESFEINRLKTTELQGARSQGFTTKIKNNVVFVSFEPIVNSLGRVANVVLTPEVTDVSHSIVNDMNSYDFSQGSSFYYRNYLYIAIPRNNIVLVYNMTNPKDMCWEAPQILPISRFSVINGELYGHSSQVGETYKLFVGYNDNGNTINANATFSFENENIRSTSKGFNKYYVEGYISANTTLTLGIQYDIDGCASQTSYPITGTSRFVCVSKNSNSFGKLSFGKAPFGGQLTQVNNDTLPPKFRLIQTMPKKPYYEYQPSFYSSGIDQQWEILAFGPASSPTSEGNNPITN